MINRIKKHIILVLCATIYTAEPIEPNNAVGIQWSENSNSGSLGKIGDYGFPPNPMNDRAKG